MKKLIISILTITFAFIVLLFFLIRYKNKNSVPKIPTNISKELISTEEKPNISMDSPDGKATLTMRTTIDKNLITYAFNTNNLIYVKTTTKNDIFSIPFNTWSPDKNYVFVKENNTGVINFLVLNASGIAFRNGSQFINVNEIFNEKLPNYLLQDATGWASGTLLIVNTNNKDGSTGPSFWFDVPSQTFILLSIRFN